MDSASFRTSVTVDEAVMILMGWADGPIELEAMNGIPSPEEEDFYGSWLFDLRDHIEDEETTLDSAYAEAREDKLPTEVIAEKREALRLFRLEATQATVCLCAVKDELNKGDASRLRIDRELSRRTVTYITRTSLDQWRKEKDVKALFGPAKQPEDDKPWLIADPRDPDPKQKWYIAARYFARLLVKEDPSLRRKRLILANKVGKKFEEYGIYRRGGKEPPDPATIVKAFIKVDLGPKF